MRTLFTGVRMSRLLALLVSTLMSPFLLMCAYFVPRGTQKTGKNAEPDALCDRWRMAKTDARRRCSQELNAGRNELLYVYNMIPYSSFI